MIAPLPAMLEGHNAWAFDCIRSLRKADTPFRTLCVPVALADEMGRSTGIVCTLMLDVVKPGGGQVFQHPQDVLTTSPEADFRKSMEDAWEQAKVLAKSHAGEEEPFDGHWRLLLENQPIKEVKGCSASGAAARGWWFALTGKVPDDRMIVLAQVDEHDPHQLTKVSGIAAKTKAIMEDGKFQIDTIVVVSRDNYEEAKSTGKVLSEEKDKKSALMTVGAAARTIAVRLLDDGNP